MPDQVQPAAAGANPQGEQRSTFSQIITTLQQVFIFWVISQLILKYFGPKQEPPSPPAIPSAYPSQAAQESPVADVPSPHELPPQSASLGWPLGMSLDMHVYLTTSPTGDVFSSKNKEDRGLPSFVWGNMTFGSWDEKRVVDFMVDLPYSVQHNGSLWADIYLVKSGLSPEYAATSNHPLVQHHVRKLLTRYLPKLKVRKETNLLSGSDETDEVEEESDDEPPMSHWHQNLTIALISDNTGISVSQLPPPIAEHVHLIPGLRDETGTKGFYKPIVFPNDFWHLRSQYIEINETTPSLPLQIVFQPMSYFKFQLFASMTFGFNEATKKQGGGSAEIDEVKRMLVETNPWFLGLTGFVSILHVVFEMLAFKNDVSHWRKKNELVGVSVRTIVANVFVQLIILLYLIDNNTDTSWMILMGQGVGILIEAWKITKAVDIKFVPSAAGSLLPYQLQITDKHVLSEDEKKTQEYDKLAFRWVSYVAIPCLMGYTVYSLIYKTHRGWYSFVISTLTSFVYMFGFVQLVPQLIINYKLKSVAHMPMKAMIYKTLSTVVDDLFAFCIKMPILHRLACFRDDVVFLVFLYQRWIYRVDPKRVNEYGQVMTENAEETSEQETKKNQ